MDAVVFSVGFDRTTQHSIESVYVDGLQRCLDWCDTSIRRFIYCSSTGVYGATSGAWMDETSPCNPTRAGGKACLAAERLLENHDVVGPKSVILRLAGIYGTGRLPLLEDLRQGKPLAVDPDGYLNLIHVDDIVRVIDACASEAKSGVSTPLKLCVADGHPIQRREFYEQLATNHGVPAPKFASPPSGSPRAERARGNKRISNRLMLDLLNLSLRHPTFREGLQSIQTRLRTDQNPD